MVRVEVPEPPAMLVLLKVATGPEGATVAESDTTPLKPLMLETVITDVAEAPELIVRADGVALMPKSGTGEVEKTAVCTVSGAGVGLGGDATDTQTSPAPACATLLLLQVCVLVWKPIGIVAGWVTL